MELDLKSEEIEALRQILSAALGELRVEVRHTREATVKDLLKHNEELLRNILGQLERAS